MLRYLVPSRRPRAGRLPMQEFIARENIRRFEQQLAAATDERQRAQIQALLDAERRHLSEIRKSARDR